MDERRKAMEAPGVFHENTKDFEFAKSLSLLRNLGQHEGDVLDFKVEIVTTSVVLGSTSTSY
jgi:hypothetical protein